MAKRLTLVHVGKMHFDEWDAHRHQRVTYCDTGMGKCGGIDDDEPGAVLPRSVNARDQLMLCVALQCLQLMPQFAGLLDEAGIDLRQGDRAIDTRLAGAEQVEIRSEEHTSELQSRENLVCRLLLEKK